MDHLPSMRVHALAATNCRHLTRDSPDIPGSGYCPHRQVPRHGPWLIDEASAIAGCQVFIEGRQLLGFNDDEYRRLGEKNPTTAPALNRIPAWTNMGRPPHPVLFSCRAHGHRAIAPHDPSTQFLTVLCNPAR